MSLPFKKICDDFGLTPFGVRHALEQYQILITELTDGFFSKLTYDAPVILERARECFEKDMVDAEPARTGIWQRAKNGDAVYYYCSCCHIGITMHPETRHYCYHCGAKMDGGDSDENAQP